MASLRAKAAKAVPDLKPTTRVRSSVAERTRVELGRWLGEHRVPPALRGVQVTVLRAIDGAGLACVPSLSPRRFSDDAIEQGDAARALLAAVDACATPVSLQRAAHQVAADAGLGPKEAQEVIEVLVGEGFLTAEASAGSPRRGR